MPGKYERFDVTIVGAGPSGAVMAYELARQGLQVLLLEKEKLPRRKVCAGGITVRAGLLLPFDISELIENVIFGVRLSYHLVPQKVRIYDKPLAYMIKRETFDHFLVNHACNAGAVLEDGTEVQGVQVDENSVVVKTTRTSFKTPLLVGADGANSVVVRSLGLKSGFEYGLGINCNVPVNDVILRDWEGLIGLDWGIPGGYAWVFPKQDCLSVGAGSTYRVARDLKPYTLRLVRAYDLGLVEKYMVRGHRMPLRKAKTPLCYRRVLLVGDAAGLIDPLTGEGIHNGLQSSFLAADAILQFASGRVTDLTGYEAAVNRDLSPELKIARKIQKLNSLTPRIFYRFLKDNDRFWRAFCRMLRGEKTYRSLRQSLPAPLRPLF